MIYNGSSVQNEDGSSMLHRYRALLRTVPSRLLLLLAVFLLSPLRTVQLCATIAAADVAQALVELERYLRTQQRQCSMYSP